MPQAEKELLENFISDLARCVCTHTQNSILFLELIVGNNMGAKTASIIKSSVLTLLMKDILRQNMHLPK